MKKMGYMRCRDNTSLFQKLSFLWIYCCCRKQRIIFHCNKNISVEQARKWIHIHPESDEWGKEERIFICVGKASLKVDWTFCKTYSWTFLLKTLLKMLLDLKIHRVMFDLFLMQTVVFYLGVEIIALHIKFFSFGLLQITKKSSCSRYCLFMCFQCKLLSWWTHRIGIPRNNFINSIPENV